MGDKAGFVFNDVQRCAAGRASEHADTRVGKGLALHFIITAVAPGKQQGNAVSARLFKHIGNARLGLFRLLISEVGTRSDFRARITMRGNQSEGIAGFKRAQAEEHVALAGLSFGQPESAVGIWHGCSGEKPHILRAPWLGSAAFSRMMRFFAGKERI